MEDNDNAGGEQVFIVMPVFASVKRFLSLLVFTLRFTELLNNIFVQMKSSQMALLQITEKQDMKGDVG